MKKDRKAGFTLAELLIITAIIGVLAAVAVPVFAGTLEKSRETVCLHNRIVLQRHLMCDRVTNGGKEPTQEALRAYIESDQAKCTGGGAYKLEYDRSTGAIGVSCSKHAPGGLTNQAAASNAYEEWLEDYLKDPQNQSDQNSVINKYKEYLNGEFFEISQAEVEALLPSNVNGFQGAGDDDPLVWVPLRLKLGNDFEEIMVITSKQQASGTDLRKGFVFAYKDGYYWSGKTAYRDACDYGGLYTSNGIYNSFDDFISKTGWTKIEK